MSHLIYMAIIILVENSHLFQITLNGFGGGGAHILMLIAFYFYNYF